MQKNWEFTVCQCHVQDVKVFFGQCKNPTVLPNFDPPLE